MDNFYEGDPDTGRYGIPDPTELEPDHFLPRVVRVSLYIGAILFAILAPFISVTLPDYGVAASTAAGVLMAAAGGTALANLGTR